MTNRKIEVMDPMIYEMFLTEAFGLTLKKADDSVCRRYGDPAGAADTDRFSEDCLAEVKAATGYAMMIYKHHIVNQPDVDSSVHNEVKYFIEKVIECSELKQILELIKDFKKTFLFNS